MTESQTNNPNRHLPNVEIAESAANIIVRMAYDNNELRDKLKDSNTAEVQKIQEKIDNNDEFIGEAGPLSGRATVPVVTEAPSSPEPSPPLRPDRRKPLVVDPSSGRTVPYGQMRRGNHPRGGRIVGYEKTRRQR